MNNLNNIASDRFLIGVATSQFVLLATKTPVGPGGNVTETRLGAKMGLFAKGTRKDLVELRAFATKTIEKHKKQHGGNLPSPEVLHHQMLAEIAEAMKSDREHALDGFLGGYDDVTKTAFLGQIDHNGHGQSNLRFAFCGYCEKLCKDLLENQYRDSMTLDEAILLVRKCVHEVKRRFLQLEPGFTMVCIDKDGYRELAGDDL